MVYAWLLNKRKNPAMFFSSSHADNLVTADEIRKVVMILNYNKK